MRRMHDLLIVIVLATSILLLSMATAHAAEISTFTSKVGQLKKITFTLTKNAGKPEGLVYIFQVKNPDETVDQLSWVMGTLQAGQEIRPQQSWIPDKPGEYTVEIFVWGSLDNPTPLGPSLMMKVIVEE